MIPEPGEPVSYRFCLDFEHIFSNSLIDILSISINKLI